MKKRVDPRQAIVDAIVKDLEAGVAPWNKPWVSDNVSFGYPINHVGRPYSGINVLALLSAKMEHGYTSSQWMTFKQLAALGGNVKGQKSTQIFYMSTIEKVGDDGEKRNIFFAKAHYVFNIDQITGLPEKYYVKPKPLEYINIDTRSEKLDALVQKVGAVINEKRGNAACYIPAIDQINMPEFGHFDNAYSYYTTLFHELVHWTGAKIRLDREKGAVKFDSKYAFEELVAELGAAFLGGMLGMSVTPRADHAQYIDHWLGALKGGDGNRIQFITKAATAASKACEYLLEAMELGYIITGDDAPDNEIEQDKAA